MDQLAHQRFDTGPLPSADYSWTLKTRVRYLQEAALIIGVQLMFRAALLLRRWNY
jgi:hypothetical protein